MIRIIFLWLFTLLAICLVSCTAFHLVTPISWHFLTSLQIYCCGCAAFMIMCGLGAMGAYE